MPRITEDSPITGRAARERLAVRHEPYWRAIEGGLAVGYRKGKTGGVWLARLHEDGRYRKATLGRADDYIPATRGEADGSDGAEPAQVMDFRQAQAAAQAWAARQHRVAAGLEPERSDTPAAPYTVESAITDYLADYEARGGKSVKDTRTAANAHILPALGSIAVTKLTRDRLKSWHRALAAAPARVRGKVPAEPPKGATVDPEAQRRRRSTANRVLTVLKAALNHARNEGKITGAADAWAAVKPFREADKAKIRYLVDEEITRLVNSCQPDFRELVTGALLTGCRYGELSQMKGTDFDSDAGTLTVGRSKSGKPRHVVLTDEGREFFSRLAIGKAGKARLFERNGMVKQATRETPAKTKRVAWGKSDQFRFMREACEAAKIEPPVSFHELRHSYASRLAMRGVPLTFIASQLGHSDSRMTEKHYAHISGGYVADVVRQSFGRLGIVPAASGAAVTPIRCKTG